MMRRFLLVAVFSLVSFSALAQEVPSVRFYIVPKVVDAKGINRPKYVQAMGLTWSGKPFGGENGYLISAEVTNAQHTQLAANLDVIAVPTALDDPISPVALDNIQTRLEALKIPANHLTTANTYRQALHLVSAWVAFTRAFFNVNQVSFFEVGVTLSTQVNQLTQFQRQRLDDVLLSLGMDTSGITPTTTLRQILRAFAAFYPLFDMQGETI